jgi:hypothetical protein
MAAINTAITIRMNAPMTNFEPMALSSLPSRNRKEESRELPRARPASKASTVRGSYASPQVPSGSPISRDVPHSGIGPRVNAISECEKGIDVKPLRPSAYMHHPVCECGGASAVRTQCDGRPDLVDRHWSCGDCCCLHAALKS